MIASGKHRATIGMSKIKERRLGLPIDCHPGCHVGEFVFEPAHAGAAENEGWLMGLVVNAVSQTTDFVILDAQQFSGPPQAVVRLPHRVPAGFHGNWVASPAVG